MASIRKEVVINARPESIWSAARDFGALHRRLVPGFVTDARLDGDARIVTFSNGAVARERLVDLDDETRRLAWTVVESPFGLEHHNGVLQIFDEGEDQSLVVWTADLLPNDPASTIDGFMERGLEVMKRTFERPGSRS
ncbi:SRPBCC family protein [Pendulispora albinea]|uniref:SRPBCC family protein n=1 Tax=Pendulispora albinea TaxID=2741071 RepID=A0ABZ2LMR0_9BACT